MTIILFTSDSDDSYHNDFFNRKEFLVIAKFSHAWFVEHVYVILFIIASCSIVAETWFRQRSNLFTQFRFLWSSLQFLPKTFQTLQKLR